VCWDRDHNAILKDVPWSWLPRLFRGEAERTSPNLRNQHRSRTTENMQLLPSPHLFSQTEYGRKWRRPILRTSTSHCEPVKVAPAWHDTDGRLRSERCISRDGISNLQMPIFPSSLPYPSYSLTSRTQRNVTTHQEKCIALCFLHIVGLSSLLTNRLLAICQSVHRL
jgi:hypothetical protein